MSNCTFNPTIYITAFLVSSRLGGVVLGGCGGIYTGNYLSFCQLHRKCPSPNTPPPVFLQEAPGENCRRSGFLPACCCTDTLLTDCRRVLMKDGRDTTRSRIYTEMTSCPPSVPRLLLQTFYHELVSRQEPFISLNSTEACSHVHMFTCSHDLQTHSVMLN